MKDSRLKPYLLCLYTYFAVGSMVLTGNTVMKSIIAEYSWSDSQGAMLVTCMSLGFLLMSAIGNIVMEKIGRRLTMLLGSACMSLSFLTFALLPSGVYYPLMILSGFAWGGLNSLVNTVVSEMYGGHAGKLNLMNACYALGAVLLPMLVGVCTMNNVTAWRTPCLLVAGLGGLLFLLGLMIRLP